MRKRPKGENRPFKGGFFRSLFGWYAFFIGPALKSLQDLKRRLIPSVLFSQAVNFMFQSIDYGLFCFPCVHFSILLYLLGCGSPPAACGGFFGAGFLGAAFGLITLCLISKSSIASSDSLEMGILLLSESSRSFASSSGSTVVLHDSRLRPMYIHLFTLQILYVKYIQTRINTQYLDITPNLRRD